MFQGAFGRFRGLNRFPVELQVVPEVFQDVSGVFHRVFEELHNILGYFRSFQGISKGFQKRFRGVLERFQSVQVVGSFKRLQGVSEGFSWFQQATHYTRIEVSFKGHSEGFQVVTKHFSEFPFFFGFLNVFG